MKKLLIIVGLCLCAVLGLMFKMTFARLDELYEMNHELRQTMATMSDQVRQLENSAKQAQDNLAALSVRQLEQNSQLQSVDKRVQQEDSTLSSMKTDLAKGLSQK
jgi:uncharacterized phage infection (PIP) family protein YhgE